MKRFAVPVVLVALAVLVFQSSARAEWTKLNTGSSGLYLMAVHAPDSDTVVAVGMTIDTSAMMTPIIRKVLASTDGGVSFQDISANLDDTRTNVYPEAVFFLSSQRGWVGSGTKLLSTSNGGQSWTEIETGVTIGAVHFFDENNGVVVGKDGGIKVTTNGGVGWSSVTSPTTTHLRSMFWLDRQRGWACGHDERTEGDPFGEEPEQEFLENGAVIHTNDGGQSWEVVSTFATGGVGPIFMVDGSNGWLSRWERVSSEGPDELASLHVTSDGGQNFSDMSLLTRVGTIDAGFSTEPIDTSRILSMYWDDASYGHLVAIAFLMESESSSSGGGSSSSEKRVFYEIIDYLTEDGGTSWTYTQLGTIDVGFPPQLPGSDGGVTAGFLVDRYAGFVVADQSGVFRFDAPCGGDGDCEPGYDCNAGTCGQDGGGGGTTGSDAGSQTDAGSSVGTDAGTSGGQDAASDLGRGRGRTSGGSTNSGEGGEAGDDSSSCGCSSAATPACTGALTLVFVLLLGLRKRRF